VAKLPKSSCSVAWFILSAWAMSLPALVLAADPPMRAPIRNGQTASATARKPGDCELILEGKSIERLVLLDSRGLTKVIASPRTSVFLPPGRYVLQQVDFQGGFPLYPNEVLLLTPQTPTKLDVGKLLKPTVTATRKGRMLKLDYQLLDAAGQNCANKYYPYPPHFDVYLGNEKVASGNFEYG
jgi:hypothetical protein